MKQIGRREFIKYAAGTAGLLALSKFAGAPLTFSSKAAAQAPVKTPGKTNSAADAAVADPNNKFAMVIDVGACIGCRTCMWGCKDENNTPDSISPLWIEVFQLNLEGGVTAHPSPEDLKKGATTSYTKSPLPGKWYLNVACNHCSNPPCVKVCPTGATYKDPDGIVLMHYERCIGCRLCVVACPYSARRFNWVKPVVPADKINPLVEVRPIGVVEKCTFCSHRTRNGKLPRCVEVCPVRARHFGNLNDPESEVSKLLEENLSFRLLEENNTEPNIFYITRGKKWTS